MFTLFFFGLRRHLILILVMLCSLNVVDITFDFYERIPGWWRIVAYTPIRDLHYFLFGIIMYEAWQDGPDRKIFLLAIFCWVAALPPFTVLHSTVVLCLMLFMGYATLRSPRLLQFRVLVWFGTISYSTYLIHSNIGRIVILAAYEKNFNPSVAILCAFIVAIGLATALTYGVEKPAMRLLRQYRPHFLSKF